MSFRIWNRILLVGDQLVFGSRPYRRTDVRDLGRAQRRRRAGKDCGRRPGRLERCSLMAATVFLAEAMTSCAACRLVAAR